MAKVVNLATGEIRDYSCEPRLAVICAYAQSRGDNNTWEYHKYEPLVKESERFYFCGDWAVSKEPPTIDLDALKGVLEKEIRDEDIEAWHKGVLTPRIEEIVAELQALGLTLELWGVRNPRPGQESFHIVLRSTKEV